MAKDVRCEVSSCTYNDDRKCKASSITVSKCNCTNVKTEKETECETFKLK